jgi:hypothetical protein
MDKLTQYRRLIKRILEEHIQVSNRFPKPGVEHLLTFQAPETRQYTEFAAA